MSYLGNAPGQSTQRITTTFTATASQTTFTPSSGYALGLVDVYLNGVKLVDTTDFTATNGTSVVLATGAASGDTVETVAYIPRGLSDGYTKAEADAKYPTSASLATVATTGAYSDLTGKPSLATVATTGAYSDLTGTPTPFTTGKAIAMSMIFGG